MPASYVSARFSALDNSGNPAVGYQLFTYANTTTTPKPTYQDGAGATLNTNPIILDGRGEAVIFLDEAQVYTFVLKTSTGAVIWSQDSIQATGGGGSGGSGLQIFANAPPTDQGPIYVTSQGPEEFGATAYESLYSTGYKGGPWGFKNKMRNGGFTIAQRGTSFVQATPTTGVFTLDNVKLFVGSNAKFTVAQGQDLPNTQEGALGVNYLSIVSNAAVAPASTDKNKFSMAIEGFDAAQFGMGSSLVKSIPVSFRVWATVAGSYCASITNDTATRSYVFNFTVTTPSTWQRIVVYVPIDTLLGTNWKKNNNAGLVFNVDLGSGTNFETASPLTWQASHFLRTSGSVRLCATNNAEFRCTQVQIEEGVQATPFEARPVSAELVLCQRYTQYIQWSARTTSPTGGVTYWWPISWPSMRTTPALTSISRGTAANLATVSVVPNTSKNGVASLVSSGGADIYVQDETDLLDSEMTYV
jgi:hypothetical protein